MIDHREDWTDTTCPVALCSSCGQPWPCETEQERRLAAVSAEMATASKPVPLVDDAIEASWEAFLLTRGAPDD